MKNMFSNVTVSKLIAVGLLSSILFLPVSARAEIREGSIELSPFVGANLFEQGQNLENTLIYGGRLGYNITKNWGVEGTVEFMNSRVDDRFRAGTREGEFRSPMNKVTLAAYHLDALYHFLPEGRFNPFVVAGIGGVHYSPRIATQDMTAINFGVGAKYWLADRVALRLDLRDNVVSEVFQEAYHNVNATVGVVFAFGGNSKQAPAPVVVSEPKPVVTAPARSAMKAEAQPAVKAEPKAANRVVIVVAEAPEPKVVEKVKVLVSEPKLEEKVIVLAFEDVHFDFNKSTLDAAARRVLKESIRILKENPRAQIRIAGYTSAAGSEEYNQKLSERRARAVEEYLIREGIVTPDRLSTIGYGETRPAEYEAAPKVLHSKAAEANMRVLFEVIVK